VLTIIDSAILGYLEGVLLRPDFIQQPHRNLQVGEEHGDLLSLASKAALEVRIFSARCLAEPNSALATELLTRSV
jgi:hypothetical protein